MNSPSSSHKSSCFRQWNLFLQLNDPPDPRLGPEFSTTTDRICFVAVSPNKF